MADSLKGSGKGLIVTSVTVLLTSGQLGRETDPLMSNNPVAYRARSEASIKAAVQNGVRASVVRLPPSVHGLGDHGLVPALIAVARLKGFAAYIQGGRIDGLRFTAKTRHACIALLWKRRRPARYSTRSEKRGFRCTVLQPPSAGVSMCRSSIFRKQRLSIISAPWHASSTLTIRHRVLSFARRLVGTRRELSAEGHA